MARKQSYEMQAQLSLVLAIIGGLCTLAGAYFIYGAFSFADFQTVYNPESARMPSIVGSLVLGGAAAGLGWLLAYLSAGQRLNKKNKLSWTGFFLNSAVIALALSFFVFFYFTRLAQPVS